MSFNFVSQYFDRLLYSMEYKLLRFDENIDSNQLSGAHFYWTVLTAIVKKTFVLNIINN